jgi:hypothetical protein
MRHIKTLIGGTLLLAVSVGLYGQDTPYTPERLQALPESQVDELIDRAMTEQLPPRLIDALTILLLGRESLVLPKIAARLQGALKDPSHPDGIVAKLEDMVIYLATPGALDVVLSLEAREPARAERLVPRLLDHAVGWRNPYELAYRAAERGGGRIKRAVWNWVDENAARPKSARDWAKMLLLQQSNDRGIEETLAIDPLFVRVSADVQRHVRAEIELQARRAKPEK